MQIDTLRAGGSNEDAIAAAGVRECCEDQDNFNSRLPPCNLPHGPRDTGMDTFGNKLRPRQCHPCSQDRRESTAFVTRHWRTACCSASTPTSLPSSTLGRGCARPLALDGAQWGKGLGRALLQTRGVETQLIRGVPSRTPSKSPLILAGCKKSQPKRGRGSDQQDGC